jgi:hypothetical protein
MPDPIALLYSGKVKVLAGRPPNVEPVVTVKAGTPVN